MDHRILHFDWNWQLLSSPQELWPLISNTNRLNHDLRFPPVHKADLSYDYQEGHLQLAFSSLQNSDAWEEEPYQWEMPYRYGVKRRYKNGSCEEISIKVDLFKNSRGTRVRYQVWAHPRTFLASVITPFKMNVLFRRRLKSVLRDYDQLVRENLLPYQMEYQKRLVRGGKQRLEQFRKQLTDLTDEKIVVSHLFNYVLRASDLEVKRMEPYRLADHWNQSRSVVLKVFLHATKIGLLNFNWDLYCSECRTLQHSCKTLSEVHEPILCEECNREFYVNFNRSLQLSFRPNPLVRKISEAEYCLTGPQVTPHIAIKQLLKPGQKRYLKVHLQEGEYKLRIQGSRGEAYVQVTEEGKDNITVTIDRFGLNGEKTELTPEPNLIFENKTGSDKIFILERTAWRDDVVTAARVTSLQQFRDLFDNEVIRKGEKIAVDAQTLMFTDLLDSAGMYNKEGDEKAVGRVIEHFDILQQVIADENGAIIKTIGDSVMAVFSNPAKAFKAFIKAHEIIGKDKRHNRSLKLKAGIHHGSCVAVNLNNKIDYFGSTVNIAARLVDFAEEDEVVISQSICEFDEVRELLNSKELEYISKDVMARLRGFEGKQFRIKRIALEKPALRLVI